MAFLDSMRERYPSAAEARERSWVFVPCDRLNDRIGPLATDSDAGIILVESHAKGKSRPYHHKKVLLVLSNMRHFALEQIERGRHVLYLNGPESYGEQLFAAQQRFRLGSILSTRAAERELRKDLERGCASGLRLEDRPDTAWLSTSEDWQEVFGKGASRGRQFLMERFYRYMRRSTGILMEDGNYAGGKLSYDEQNREPYRGQITPPPRPTFAQDAITIELLEMMQRVNPIAFGSADGFDLPVTEADAKSAWSFALDRLLPFFGPWEDAMSTQEPMLFHSALSALMNISRLLPREIIADVETAYHQGKIPLASAEGFIRQILGWREFMRHIHDTTDGFRTLPQSPDPPSNREAHAYSATIVQTIDPATPDRPATPSALDAHLPLPPAYWGDRSGMRCLDTVVAQVRDQGWSHHITRLMVLSNLAVLCGFSPRELTDWFWVAYIDAYDWVVESNVLGMATFADGGLTATKPYVSGAAYINRMSDYCGKCPLDPKKALGPGSCPFTALYWTFLERHADLLQSNQRLRMPYIALGKKSAADRKALRERAEAAVAQLGRGEIVT
ncbi:deoxyribodipyrimidine photolyase-related protein [Terriglobus roseus DSM 18391]|uniref:Deoxyribodipyrimidine photolyase-related protein n=1 Tax=Terriglobus roseus (strain DSM 18391 / NRRL B-41598 / KBS 63) TaxID=926566 RepID=I3ZG68_TERRK|nr:cryptochrome/photolyase family protein [Terriglobus roseus]AFL88236.1 deoxyribodipyrimidine photolyase-related protein [Terriglobus roseus DSM 18391]